MKKKRLDSDAELAHALRQALKWGALLPDRTITSTVSDGWVKLEGQVRSLTERADAEWAVENLTGAAGITIGLKGEPTKTEGVTLRESIEAALERRADREAEWFRIDVKDGEVSLHGRIDAWPDRKALVGSISHAPVVKKINDNLRIDPYY